LSQLRSVRNTLTALLTTSLLRTSPSRINIRFGLLLTQRNPLSSQIASPK